MTVVGARHDIYLDREGEHRTNFIIDTDYNNFQKKKKIKHEFKSQH